ncbi:MAG: PilZ domain-containing protein, partial [Planctomycetota bacterium]
MAGTDGQRRIDTRVEKVQLVQISRFDEEGFRADLATGRTVNISRGGLRLELHHPLPLRSKVELDLALEDGLVQVSGTVVYLEVIDEERCFM